MGRADGDGPQAGDDLALAATSPAGDAPAEDPLSAVPTEASAGSIDLPEGGEADSPQEREAAEESVDRSAAPKRRRPAPSVPEVEPEAEESAPIVKQWYILKVQTNREDSIRDALQRRVAMAGLDRFFGDIIVPTEMVVEFRGGKKKVSKRKLYPGYLVVNMEINDDTWYLVRETSGIGDFTGAMGRPSPMAPQDVAKILSKTEEKADAAPKPKIGFKPQDRVKINEGTFENFEGNVESVDEANGRVTVMINIFGRSTPVELEYWQIEAV